MFLFVFHLPVLAVVGLGLLVAGPDRGRHAGPAVDEVTSVLWTLLLLGPMLELSTGLLLAARAAPQGRPADLLPAAVHGVDGAVHQGLGRRLLGRPYTWVKTARSGEPDPGRHRRPSPWRAGR